MSGFWQDIPVLVTGGTGFIGSHLVERLVGEGARVRVADNLSAGPISNLAESLDQVEFVRTDLTDLEACREACRDVSFVFALAAKVAGIQFNKDHSGDMIRINSRISMNTLEAARLEDVQRYLVVSSACVYSPDCSVPTPESEGLLGQPERTNWGYGWAKRFSEIQAAAYADQYGMRIGIVRPYNTYGPRDHFSLPDAHVIPALIARLMRRQDSLEVYGSGRQSRSFVFVKDVAEGMLLTLQHHPEPDPVNIGSDEEITVGDLARLIAKILGCDPKILFDTTQPDGHARRKPDTRKASAKVGFRSKVSLREGLADTINWAKDQLTVSAIA